MEYGLIGAKLGHSYSVPIHAMLGDYDYRLYERAEEDFIALVKSRAFRGLNVTIPYKKTALELCDSLSDIAREVGSVNTLVVRPDGSLYGHNTDIGGFIAMAKHAGIDIEGRKAVILGSGGTSLTARTACRHMGAREIIVVSRKGPVDYDALYREHTDAEILINTTPVGMYPNNGQSPVDIGAFADLRGVLDVVYNPDKTALILDARARNIPCAGGLYMLVGQAREAAELFMGRPVPESETERIYAAIRSDMLNIVLIGMPGSGKSSVGRALADTLGRDFIDCDEEIVRRAGKSIPEVFAQDGEPAFRDLESRVIADLCREKRCVIATGGGAVMRAENVRAMKQNGVCVMLKRDIEALPLDGRPLSASRDSVRALWETRRPHYLKCADAVVENNDSLIKTTAEVKEAFHEAAGH